jgi:hypothetical protein
MKKQIQKKLQLGKIQIASLSNDPQNHQKIADSWTFGSCWPLRCNPIPTTDLEKGRP